MYARVSLDKEAFLVKDDIRMNVCACLDKEGYLV